LAMLDRTSAQEEHDDLKREVDAFEHASGIRLGRWSAGSRLGKAVSVLVKHSPEEMSRIVDRVAERLRTEVGSLEQMGKELKEALKPLEVEDGE